MKGSGFDLSENSMKNNKTELFGMHVFGIMLDMPEIQKD